MKKKLTALLVGAVLMVSASAWALPSAGKGYSWINAPFWTNTDHTTSVNGNSTFTLLVENSNIGGTSFGLFYVNDINVPTSPTRFEVFSNTAAPDPEDPTTKTITFWNNNSNFKITDSATPKAVGTTWTSFRSVFGFYFGYDTYTSNPSSVTTSYYYSAPTLDTDANDLNVFTSVNGNNMVHVFLDTNLTDTAYNMKISGNDLIPVPEPGTMVLLGAGMLCLAIYGKRRMNKDA